MSEGDRTIQLDTMSLEELHQLRQQEESRGQGLGARYAQLRQAHARLMASQQAVRDLKASPEGQTVLLPLTESVYVPGKILEPHKVMIDLGTGFYCEKSAKEALAYVERRAKLVDRNSENITQAMQATRQNLEAIQVSMQGKLLEIRAKQEGVRHRAAVEG